MIIERWDGSSWWDELEQFAELIDTHEMFRPLFAAKVAVLHVKVRAAIFLVLNDSRTELLGYFTVKDCGDFCYVHDFVLNPKNAMMNARLAIKIKKFIKDLGFKEIRAKVRKTNTPAIKLYDWLGFNITHHDLSLSLEH